MPMGRRVDPLEIARTMARARLQPLERYPGHNSAPWRCRCLRCGEEVWPNWSNLQRGQGGCKYCAGSAVPQATRLKTMLDASVRPLEPYPGKNNLPWKSRCLRCGRQVEPVYSNIQRGQGACKYCARRGVVPAEAEMKMRAASMQPLEPYHGSGTPWRCICLRCGSEVSPRFSNVSSGQGACKYCAGRVVDADAAAEEMRQAGVTPLEPFPGVVTPWLCRCDECQRTVTPRLGNVRAGQGACKYCGRVGVDPDEASRRMLAAGLLPLVPYPGSGVRWRCECQRCGRIVTPLWDVIVAGGGGCRYCAPNAPIDPDLAVRTMQEASLTPLQGFPGANEPWPCTCDTCGRQVAPAFSSVRDGSAGCRYCSGHAVAPEVAEEVMVTAGLRPVEPYPGANRPWRSVCQVCRNEVTPRLANVRIRGRGCLFCAAWGTDYLGPAVLYLIEDPSRGARKIGIAGQNTGRVAQWRRRGWTVSRVWEFRTGAGAFRVEQAVIAWWRSTLGLPPKLADQDGWTETVDSVCVSAEDVIGFVDSVNSENALQSLDN